MKAGTDDREPCHTSNVCERGWPDLAPLPSRPSSSPPALPAGGFLYARPPREQHGGCQKNHYDPAIAAPFWGLVSILLRSLIP